MNQGHIYIIDFPNGKKYVGQTVQTPQRRFKRRGCAHSEATRAKLLWSDPEYRARMIAARVS